MSKKQELNGTISALRERIKQLTVLVDEKAKIIAEQDIAVKQACAICDTYIALCAERCGIKVEEDGKLLGYRLEFTVEEVRNALNRYEVKASKQKRESDGVEIYSAGVIPKEDKKPAPKKRSVKKK